MANELQTQYATGSNLYAVILNAAGQAWTGTGNVFESLNSSHWSNYAVPLTEQIASGIYFANFPTAVTTAGPYNVLLRLRAGGSPAIADTAIGGSQIIWSGAAEIPASPGFSTLTYGSFK
jgi:hypothetical protein